MDIPSIPIRFAPISDNVEQKWLTSLKNYGIVYLCALLGSGKTLQSVYFAKKNYKDYAYFSAKDENFIDKLESFLETYRKKRSKTLLIIDDVSYVRLEEDRHRFFACLLKRRDFDANLQFILLSRSELPDYLTSLRITQHLEVGDRKSFVLEKKQIVKLFESYENLSALTPSYRNKMAELCQKGTMGHGIGVQLFTMRLDETPHDLETVKRRMYQDMYYHLDMGFAKSFPEPIFTALVKMGVFRSFDLAAAKLILGEDAGYYLEQFIDIGSFLHYKAPDTYSFHQYFPQYLDYRLTLIDDSTRKQLYFLTGGYHEEKRDYEEALRAYKKAERLDKLEEIVVYLLENAEGSVFAQLSAQYIDDIPEERERENPSIIGAKSMLAAYQMEIEESQFHLERLRKMAETEESEYLREKALASYVRTLIASPCTTAEKLKDNLKICGDYVRQTGAPLKNIMPTGNFPSVINGGLDLLSWIPERENIYPILKEVLPQILGQEGVGAADVALGEMYYEQGEYSRAMANLVRAQSDAHFKGSLRVQYAATALIARLLQGDGQLSSAKDIIKTSLDRAKQQNFSELLPNMEASLIHCALLGRDMDSCIHWIQNKAPDEQGKFYITMRFLFYTKAQVYIALGRYIEAVHIINKLQTYTSLYHRPYYQIKLLLLKAVVKFRLKEDWEKYLLDALRQAQPYYLVRVVADLGAALLPLWKEMNWEKKQDLDSAYITAITKALITMAQYYPKYLQPMNLGCELTEKEREVLDLLVEGASNASIAQTMGFTQSSAKFHVANIMKKLDAPNRTAVVRRAQELGLV